MYSLSTVEKRLEIGKQTKKYKDDLIIASEIEFPSIGFFLCTVGSHPWSAMYAKLSHHDANWEPDRHRGERLRDQTET